MTVRANDGVAQPLVIRGFRIYQGLLDRDAQCALLREVASISALAPPFRPETPGGRKMSVRMTSAGRAGWFSDRRGYRYARRHPSGAPWPPIPAPLIALWRRLFPDLGLPDSCLINFYDEGARMGMHQDRDEADFSYPVLSVSLGDEALFRMGNVTRGGRTESIWLKSGDVVVIGGSARLAHHGVDRIRFGSSRLLDGGGRINLTLRVAGA